MIPARYQPPLPLDRLLLPVGAPGAGDRMELDVLIVGAGPAGLACAIELAHLAQRDRTDVNIGVLEKAEALGEHSLSGAVVNPRAFRELFPDVKDADFPFRGPVERERVALLTARRAFTLPTPPTMHNAGNYVASLCEIVRWLGERATALGVNLFTGFPAASLLVNGRRVMGVRTTATGLDREGGRLSNYMAPNDLLAKVTALAEGTRGSLSQAWLGRLRGCAVPEGDPLRHAVGDVRRPRHLCGPPGRRRVRRRARRVRPAGERVLHHERPVSHPQHAARVQGRVLCRRRKGGADDGHRRAVPRPKDRGGAGRKRGAYTDPGCKPGDHPRPPSHPL